MPIGDPFSRYGPRRSENRRASSHGAWRRYGREIGHTHDVHLKGAEGAAHSFVTGRLVYVGKMKPEMKLQTPQGDKTFPLVRQDVKTGSFEEGSLVTAELNQAGSASQRLIGEGSRWLRLKGFAALV